MPTLKQLAGGMRQALDWAHQAQRHDAYMMLTLKNGLQIVYSYRGDEWRLALRREGAPPSENEVEIIRRDFDVPESAARFDNMMSETNPHSGRKIRYHRVELLWREQIPCQNDGAVGGGRHLPLAASTYAPVEGSDAAVWGG
jgi:hypothetical protein